MRHGFARDLALRQAGREQRALAHSGLLVTTTQRSADSSISS
jgi:hypothetical protein